MCLSYEVPKESIAFNRQALFLPVEWKCGRVRFKAADLKSATPKGVVGSNPTASAIKKKGG